MIKYLHNINVGRWLVLLMGVCCVGNAFAYTVTLKTANCAKSITYTVADNTTHAIHANPLDGYHFESWNDGNTDNPRTIVVTEDTSFTATMVANEYEVTFNANGGTVSPESKVVTFDAAYGELPVPTRTGYSFDGWFTEAEAGTQVESTTMYTVVGNQELFAHWTINTYIVNGEEYEYGQEVVLTAADSACHHFTQWSDGVTEPSRIITVTSDTTCVEEYEVDRYTIVAHTAGGTVTGAGEYDCGTSVELVAVPDTGATFLEWSDGIKTASRTVEVTEDLQFEAIFKRVVDIVINHDCDQNN